MPIIRTEGMSLVVNMPGRNSGEISWSTSSGAATRTFLKRHSITVYFLLAFAISWGCVTAVLGPGGVLDTTVDEKQVERLLP
jgi:hypothetical protein